MCSVGRFAQRGAVPPVYLACSCNFDRDDESGEIFSYEVCRGSQEVCRGSQEVCRGSQEVSVHVSHTSSLEHGAWGMGHGACWTMTNMLHAPCPMPHSLAQFYTSALADGYW